LVASASRSANSIAKAGLRAFVISSNMGLPDGNSGYNLPPAEIQPLVAGFIAEVSGA
jgi:3-hexulose-6-phosphate synthase